MYTDKNYQTKKQLIEDFKVGKQITTYQPGGMFPAQRDGRVSIEGPHYPEPHRWYASATLKDGIIIKVS
tara:strand:- start:10 stop:216 length:207 start_codon:yes stop_codon:yes gene_type:complete